MPKQKAGSNITAKSPQEVKVFEPSLAMEKWLDTAINLVSDSPTEISKASGLVKQNWYNWLKMEGFEDWYYANYKKKRRRWLPTLDMIGMKRSSDEFKYWEAMNKKSGDILDDGASTSVQVNVLTQIKNDQDKYGV